MQPPQAPPITLLAHRGVWSERTQQNTAAAFSSAWSLGVGIETDLRDLDGEVVVSHDMPQASQGPMTLTALLDAWRSAGRRGPLALNIKADGLAGPVADALEDYDAWSSAFVFDMSVPDQMAHAQTSTAVFTRWSDFEAPAFTGDEVGIWLDAFADDGWWNAHAVRRYLAEGLRVVLVSPELHRREHLPVWRRVQAEGLDRVPGFGLCTDHIEQAMHFFGLTPPVAGRTTFAEVPA